MAHTLSRRDFCSLATGAALAGTAAGLRGQAPSAAHANVLDLDRANVLIQGKAAGTVSVEPPPQQHFHSETETNLSTAGQTSQPRLLRTDAAALERMSHTVAALVTAWLASKDAAFAKEAVEHLRPWFLDSQTKLEPSFDQAGCAAGSTVGSPAGVVDLVPLAEMARASSFLTDTLTEGELQLLQEWFSTALQWLNGNRQASIARDTKDHRASAWLLLASAFARFVRDEQTLEDCRKRFRTHTLRNQVSPAGVFPQEVATPNPYRNTLLNFDLLTGACQLLHSQFDPLWDYELIDGVGLHSVAAYLYPVIAHPERWGYPADAQHFRDLPGRRPALLFTGRAYNRPEYVELWQSLPPAPPESVGESFPIRQPVLWVTRAPHGL